jgi:hypothetical protein
VLRRWAAGVAEEERSGTAGSAGLPPVPSAGARVVPSLLRIRRRGDANVTALLCWRRWDVKEMKTTIHVRQRAIFLAVLHYVVGLRLKTTIFYSKKQGRAQTNANPLGTIYFI